MVYLHEIALPEYKSLTGSLGYVSLGIGVVLGILVVAAVIYTVTGGEWQAGGLLHQHSEAVVLPCSVVLQQPGFNLQGFQSPHRSRPALLLPPLPRPAAAAAVVWLLQRPCLCGAGVYPSCWQPSPSWLPSLCATTCPKARR